MRAADISIGDHLTTGVVTRVSRGRYVRVVVATPENTSRTHVYRPETVVATPEHPEPGKYEQGHPWARWRTAGALPKARR